MQNRTDAQVSKSKRRLSRFAAQLAKVIDIAREEGETFEFKYTPPKSDEEPATVTPLEEWKRKREG